MDEFSDIVKTTRKALGVSLQSFVDSLSAYAPEGERYTTRQTAQYWEAGRNYPRVSWLGWIANHAPGDSWQRGFAMRGVQSLSGGTDPEPGEPGPVSDTDKLESMEDANTLAR